MKSLVCFLVLVSVMACENSSNSVESEVLATRFEESWNSGSPEQILKIREEIARSTVLNPYSLYCRSWLLAKRGDIPEALKTADSLAMGFPTFVKGIYLRGNLRAENGDTAGAIQDFDKTLKKEPGFYEAWMNRGALHFQSGHPELALQDFRTAMKLKPVLPEPGFNLGNAWMALGRADSACRLWKRSSVMGYLPAKESHDRFCQPLAP